VAGEEGFERVEVVRLHEANQVAIGGERSSGDGSGPVVQREPLQLGDGSLSALFRTIPERDLKGSVATSLRFAARSAARPMPHVAPGSAGCQAKATAST